MKLNAKISSERASRTVSKSGNKEIKIKLSFKNREVAWIDMYIFENELIIEFQKSGNNPETLLTQSIIPIE